MAYIKQTGEVLIGMGFFASDFDVMATSPTTTEIVGWFSGQPQPTETEVNNAFIANPNAFTEMLVARTIATVGRVTMLRKTGPQTHNQQAPVTVTDLGFPLLPNSHYVFRYKGFYTAAAATTGLRIGLIGPASPNLLRIEQSVYESATSLRTLSAIAYDTPVETLTP